MNDSWKPRVWVQTCKCGCQIMIRPVYRFPRHYDDPTHAISSLPPAQAAKLELEFTWAESPKWEVVMFGSGTHIVTRNQADKPHYYVYADNRYEVCKQLRDWLNGGPDPTWRKHLVRKSGISCYADDGIDISAVGPFVLPENDNGALNWQVDPSKVSERIEMIDLLMS